MTSRPPRATGAPSQASGGFDFARLDLAATAGAGPAPVYRVLYQRIREAILTGQRGAGSRLPSTRALASTLSVARGTVEAAYELLVAEGYVIGRGAAGSAVNPQLAGTRPVRRDVTASVIPSAGRQAGGPLPLQNGTPALDAFPRKLWARLSARQARNFPSSALPYQDPAGWWPLRAALANYLAISRGVQCAPEQIMINAGYQGALALAAKLLLQPGDEVWHEDPGYFFTRDALQLAGATIIPVPVDGQGIDVAAGLRRAPGARLVVVTPSHQAPLGMALSLPRRLALLQWAAEHGAWIVEDDYDSELRYSGAPLPALKSLDQQGRVLYAGSFSKVLFPGLRLGYLVLPDALIERFTTASTLWWSAHGWLEQATVAEFMEQGHFSRHVRQMRQLYAARRMALVEALQCHLGEHIDAAPPAGGMHLLGWLRPDASDQACARDARHHRLAPAALTPWCIEARMRPALLLNFTNLPAEHAVQTVRRLARVKGL